MPPSTGSGVRDQRNWTKNESTYRIGYGDWLAVDLCQLLFPWSTRVDSYRHVQRPWPRPPRQEIWNRMDTWWDHFRFVEKKNVAILVVDSRRNDLKMRYASPKSVSDREKAVAILEQAR